MKRWLTHLAPTVIAVLLIGGVAFATASSKDARKETVLKLLDVSDKFEFVDVGEPASGEGDFSPGDMLMFDNIVRNKSNTESLGRFLSICTMSASPGAARCSGTVTLEKGTIELSTTVDFADADRIVAAVTGGTRAFKSAHGQAILGEQVSDTAREFTIKLRL